jgi:hydantoinase/carbamoylase family amidase
VTPRPRIDIDREGSAARMRDDIATLSGAAYTDSDTAICRYAYTRAYRNTVDYFAHELAALDFDVYEDPVGTLVARNRPRGEAVFGLGSHADSNRNGGRYDGTLGVVAAVEVCRLAREMNRDLPLQVISFLEEEGSGFGQMLLGSRITAQRVDEDDLRERFRAIDDDRSFWDHALQAGHQPERWLESARILDDLSGWIELHIEQGRVLQDTATQIGIVTAIAGYIHADIWIEGRADHAGATPMGFRLDAALAAAEVMLEAERLALAAGDDTVATIGEVEIHPNLVNVVPGRARLSLDTRGTTEASFEALAGDLAAFAEAAAGRRGMTARLERRQAQPVTRMDEAIVSALERAATAGGVRFMSMPSGAAHDTMCVADRIPSAMVFVPCRDGVSHAPEEFADVADAAVGVEVVLNAIEALSTG